MKNSIIKLKIITFVFCLPMGFAYGEETGSAEYDSGAVTNPYNIDTVHEHIPDDNTGCNKAKENIANFCSKNVDLQNAQIQMKLSKHLSSGTNGTASDTQSAMNASRTTISALGKIQSTCAVAAKQCHHVCDTHIRTVHQVNIQKRYNVAGEKREINRKRQIMELCTQETESITKQTIAMQGNLAEILNALMGIMQMIGGKDSGGASLAGTEDSETDYESCDPEKNPLASSLLACQENSGPTGTRAGVSGLAGLNGSTGTSLDTDLFGNGDTSGEPGGESQGSDNGGGSSSGGANPFTAGAGGSGGGFGASALGAATGTGVDSGASEDDGFGGYMGVGSSGSGGGGGSYGGGASYGGGSSSYGGGQGALAGGFGNKASLQRQLNKYAGSAKKRKLASEGGTNGPFEDNWQVIRKAYKKNSSTMFHQQ